MSDTLRVNNLFTTAIAYSTLTGSTITTSSITTPVIATTTGFTTIGQNTSFPNRFVEIGSDAANSVYFDFHSSDSALPDYSTRIQSNGGATTGQGHMSLQGSTINILGTNGVGIGTSNPGNAFHVYGASAPAIGMGNSTAANFFQIGAASFGGSYSASAAAGDAVIRTTSGNLMFQTGTGAAAVYVNTSNNIIMNYNASSPSTYKLCVEQGLSNNNGILISNSNYGSQQQFQLSMVNAGSGNFYSYAMIQTNTAGVAASVPLCLQPNSASVGIGTNAPTGKCHVYGGGQSTALSDVYSFNGDGGRTVYSESINMKAGDLTWANYGVRVYGARIYIGGGYSINGAQNQGVIAMYTGNTERVRVSDTGNVGIGTATPGFKLDVVGAVQINTSVATGLTCISSAAEFVVNCAGNGPFSIDPNHTTNSYIRVWDQLTVTGNFSVSGTKSFSIPHPYPTKRDQGYYLYHSCLETPNAGDTIERFQVSITNDSLHHVITMPDYYYYMCNNVMVLIQSVDTFGRSKYRLERDDTAQIVYVHVDVSEAGMYNIIVIGTRCDKEAQRGNFQLEKIHENGVREIIDRSIKKERECLYCSDCCPDEHPTL